MACTGIREIDGLTGSTRLIKLLWIVYVKLFIWIFSCGRARTHLHMFK